MISRRYRFHGHGSLGFAYRKGTTVRGQLFALRFVPNNRLQNYRAAVVVSRKVHKSAVVRNRIRRRLYALIQEELPSTTPPHDLIITVFSDKVAELAAPELRQALLTLLKKAGLR
jgi:ribonuclease P protein component